MKTPESKRVARPLGEAFVQWLEDLFYVAVRDGKGPYQYCQVYLNEKWHVISRTKDDNILVIPGPLVTRLDDFINTKGL